MPVLAKMGVSVGAVALNATGANLRIVSDIVPLLASLGIAPHPRAATVRV